MQKRFIVAWLVVLALTPVVWGAANLNFSKSNINRYLLVFPADLVTAAKAKAMHAALDKIGRADEAKLKQWLTENFQRHGIDGSRVKKVVVLSPSKKIKETAIILLTDPADEAPAIAFATTVKSSKSNSSD